MNRNDFVDAARSLSWKLFWLLALVFTVLLFGLFLFVFRTPLEAAQVGYRGVAMEVVEFADDAADKAAANVPPAPVYDLSPEELEGPRAIELYENVQVLGHLSDGEFNRIMAQITEWVSPDGAEYENGMIGGCGYCHEPPEGSPQEAYDNYFAHDLNYAKVVARRMFQMTQTINSEWRAHVYAADAEGPGVNCYTCHRGQPVPQHIWFLDPATEDMTAGALGLGQDNGQNTPVEANGYTDLNVEPYSAYILRNEGARVIDGVPITTEQGESIQKTEKTYAFMIHQSRALGVNCTFCHNSRAFTSWEQSPPQRATAWHGQEMARAINVDYLAPLTPVYPEHRLGPLGDAPKLNCATCHQGAHKPLLGANMVEAYPSLREPGPANLQHEATWPTTR